MSTKTFDQHVLDFDKEAEVEKICMRMRTLLSKTLRRRGLVVALSGGIDSSVTLALAVKAIGAKRVLGLLMPERHSADETLDLSTKVAD
jgi:NAD+ synthase